MLRATLIDALDSRVAITQSKSFESRVTSLFMRNIKNQVLLSV
jgi:hypothetical protein